MTPQVSITDELDNVPDRSHPPALWYLATSEGCERFSYYGMQTLLVLYMAEYLFKENRSQAVFGFGSFERGLEFIYGSLSPAALASITFGLYSSFVYLTPIVGGLIADRLIGRTRTILIGAILMVFGHFAMAIEPLFLLALFLLLVGTGCFKGNIASQLGSLYKPDDPRRSRAFQVFYLGISVGAILAPLICGTLGEVFGWHYGFAAAGIGMVIALAIYLSAKGRIAETSSSDDSACERIELSTIKTPSSKKQILIILMLLPVLSLMAVPNQQIFNAYLLWGKSNYDFQIFSMTIPVTWLISLDAIATVAFLGLSVGGWKIYSRYFTEPQDTTKIVLSGVVTMAAFLLLAIISSISPNGGVSLGWAILFHAINSLAFANMVPVSLSLFTRMAPASLGATTVGIYYVHLFVANNVVGWLGGFLEVLAPAQFWLLHVGIAAAGTIGVILWSVIARSSGKSASSPA